jgi:hypothetical protein
MFSDTSTLIGINSISIYLSGRGTVGKQEGIGGEHAVLCCQSIPTIWVIMPVCILSWFWFLPSSFLSSFSSEERKGTVTFTNGISKWREGQEPALSLAGPRQEHTDSGDGTAHCSESQGLDGDVANWETKWWIEGDGTDLPIFLTGVSGIILSSSHWQVSCDNRFSR